jgi:hypothetical protein
MSGDIHFGLDITADNLREFEDALKEMGMVSALALIVLNATFASLAQKGTRPHRMTVSSRWPVSWLSRTTGWKLCGATL